MFQASGFRDVDQSSQALASNIFTYSAPSLPIDRLSLSSSDRIEHALDFNPIIHLIRAAIKNQLQTI
jgi:hypothetical protein